MKKLLFLALFISALTIAVKAQTPADRYIMDAQMAIKSKHYKEALLALAQASNELNMMIGQEVMAMMPKEVTGFKSKDGEDNVSTAAMGMMGGGLTLIRNYANGDGTQFANVSIIANSPLISSINMMLSNPYMMQSAGTGQKMVSVGSYKGLLTGSTPAEGEVPTMDLQLPFGQSLMTIHFEGLKSEAEIMAFVEKFDLKAMAKLLGE